jgi:hypothetical protein
VLILSLLARNDPALQTEWGDLHFKQKNKLQTRCKILWTLQTLCKTFSFPPPTTLIAFHFPFSKEKEIKINKKEVDQELPSLL